MSFAARQRQLAERLRWAPTRGPRREALLEELRALVRDELRREVEMQQPTMPQARPYRRAPRPFYWQDSEQEARHG